MARSARARKMAAKKAASKKVAETAQDVEDSSVDISARTVQAQLMTAPSDWNMSFSDLSLNFHGKPLITESELQMNFGSRYGLVASNGEGKTTFLRSLASREVPIPEMFDIFLLEKEYPPTDETCIEAVLKEVEAETDRLEKLFLEVVENDDEDNEATINLLSQRLEDLDPEGAPARAARILFGLGFDAVNQQKKCCEFSGGWRMRIALARALFTQPSLLLLDEPTAHLDLDSVVWLERALSKYPGTIVLTSHSADFMNSVCTNVILLRHKKLYAFRGNFSTFLDTRANMNAQRARLAQKQARECAKVKAFVQRFGATNAKMSRQAKSREKMLERMEANAQEVQMLTDTPVYIKFPQCAPMPSPIIQFRDVAFRYPTMEYDLYTEVNLGIGMGDLIFVVGSNGSGKTTLMKLLREQLTPTFGDVRTHSHAKIAVYHQHLAEELPLDMSPLEHFTRSFPNVADVMEHRRALGQVGLSSETQTAPIGHLSDGQRSRIAIAMICRESPNVLLLDEPTNSLDMATIEGLGRALREFNGAVMTITHDFRLIDEAARGIEPGSGKSVYIWHVNTETRKVEIFDDDIFAYKKLLVSRVEENMERGLASIANQL